MMRLATAIIHPTLLSALVLVLALSPPFQLFSPLISQKLLRTAADLVPLDPPQYPQFTDLAGSWRLFSPDTWTSGFFPAALYELSVRHALCHSTAPSDQSDPALVQARALTGGLLVLLRPEHNHVGHDVGFISFPFAAELAINPSNATARNAINAFASILAERYSPVVRATRSWDSPDDPDKFVVIIDNMMNLDLLFLSASLTNNETLADIARAHADTTLENHIRPDGSTWHVIEYSASTGAVTKKRTAQGFSDDSTWSRGQAWAIYGFATMYDHTSNSTYLETARRLSTYFLSHIPKDNIVPWDFDAPLYPYRPADSSAAMIAANGLLLLSKLETDNGAKQTWRDAAIELLQNMTALAWNPSWQSLLSNGTVNKPAGNELTGTVYGDYYFIKAGNELIKQGDAQCQEFHSSGVGRQ